MPGGHPEAWPHVKKIFQDIAAKVESGEPCCDWVGDEGAGHYVKMVHNGIEYGDIQLICEAYAFDAQSLRSIIRANGIDFCQIGTHESWIAISLKYRVTFSAQMILMESHWLIRSSMSQGRRGRGNGQRSIRWRWESQSP